MHYSQDRADAQCEVSLLGKMPSGPTAGACAALRRLVRYLMVTRGAVNWLPKPDLVGANVELIGDANGDWAGDLQTRRSQSSGEIEIDALPMRWSSRCRPVAATCSGAAEFCAATAVVEDLLHF